MSDDSELAHITYHDLYASILFLSALYASGLLFSRILKMPSLVGEILCGVMLGPHFLDFVPNVDAFLMLGEIGLTLSVLEAGIDIDLTTLKLIGANGVSIAVIGTILPVSIGSVIAVILGYRGVQAISAGCSFAPTSLGIAMSVLRQSSIANTPVGQLVIAAAIIDDMIALVILSQLQIFESDNITLEEIAIPIVCALVFLSVGGYLAIFIIPKLLKRYVLDCLPGAIGFSRNWVSLGLTVAMLLGLLPVAYYSNVSPLMGAFLAGLSFCSDIGAHQMFITQFKRVNQWLLRIFFAASIGFQVPLPRFANPTVLWHGFVLSLALLGKLSVGFLTPNLTVKKRFRGSHLRDCLVVGFSMAAEGEFAFVIAAYSVNHGMISKDLYASIVLAVLLSTMIAPFCLRSTIGHFNTKVKSALLSSAESPGSWLADAIKEQSTVFYCIQTRSGSMWGMQSRLLFALKSLELDVIDHRSWHLRQSDRLVVNEIYARDVHAAFQTNDKDQIEKLLSGRISDIKVLLDGIVRKTDGSVHVKRWYPDLYSPDSDDESMASDISDRVMQAASTALRESLERSAAYTQMIDSSTRQKETDDVFDGRLAGLIRRDRASVIASKESVELLEVKNP